MVEEEASKRIEMLVKKRVEEELERRRSEIELEVSRRVEEAKAKMEQELILELEKRREAAREEERKREVGYRPGGGMRRQTDRYTPWHRLYVPVRCSVSLSLSCDSFPNLNFRDEPYFSTLTITVNIHTHCDRIIIIIM